MNKVRPMFAVTSATLLDIPRLLARILTQHNSATRNISSICATKVTIEGIQTDVIAAVTSRTGWRTAMPLLTLTAI